MTVEVGMIGLLVSQKQLQVMVLAVKEWSQQSYREALILVKIQ
jgi:hypothetical protein